MCKSCPKANSLIKSEKSIGLHASPCLTPLTQRGNVRMCVCMHNIKFKNNYHHPSSTYVFDFLWADVQHLPQESCWNIWHNAHKGDIWKGSGSSSQWSSKVTPPLFVKGGDRW